MLVIIPVTLFSVSYETGSGRLYSSFERLVLRAITSGNNDLNLRMIWSGVCRRRLVIVSSSLPQSWGIGLAQHLDHYEGVTSPRPWACPRFRFEARQEPRNPLTSMFAPTTPLMCPSTAERGVRSSSAVA
jgi:hypothetical protein